MVKYLPTMQETWVRSLGWEDPLEKEMTTHSSTLAWKIPWTEEPGRLQSIMGLQKDSDMTEQLHFHFQTNMLLLLSHFQSCPTPCSLIRQKPTRLLRPWDSPGKNNGVGCHFLLPKQIY